MWFRTWIDSDSNHRLTEQNDPFAGFTWNDAEHESPVPLDSEDMKPEVAAD